MNSPIVKAFLPNILNTPFVFEPNFAEILLSFFISSVLSTYFKRFIVSNLEAVFLLIKEIFSKSSFVCLKSIVFENEVIFDFRFTMLNRKSKI